MELKDVSTVIREYTRTRPWSYKSQMHPMNVGKWLDSYPVSSSLRCIPTTGLWEVWVNGIFWCIPELQLMEEWFISCVKKNQNILMKVFQNLEHITLFNHSSRQQTIFELSWVPYTASSCKSNIILGTEMYRNHNWSMELEINETNQHKISKRPSFSTCNTTQNQVNISPHRFSPNNRILLFFFLPWREHHPPKI